MESKAYLIKGVKDRERLKQEFLEKLKNMVSASAVRDGNVITIKEEGSWADSTATVAFIDKGPDVEVNVRSSHVAANKAFLVGCVLAFFGLVLIVIPWILYDEETKSFDRNLANVCNYFFFQ